MIEVTVAELAALLDADLIDEQGVAAATSIAGLVVDSRLAGPDALFVALPGERVDGHDYLPAAFEAGAVAALTARPMPTGPRPCLVTADPVVALGRIARDQVDRGLAGGLRVAAITGSQGKTSTKDLLAQVLESVGPTVAPHGNFNNEIGLPLTVARIDAGTRYLVAEMGARGVGHIAYLCTIAPPEIGVVLNVGTAHVGEFGSVEAIAVAKGELVESLPETGVAVLNADDPRAWAMRSRTRADVLGFSVLGPPPGPGVWSSHVRLRGDGGATFRLHTSAGPDRQVEVQLQVAGRHQVGNALAAAAAGQALGLDLETLGRALSTARARSRWRMEMLRRPGGGLVVNDAYNANPESMRAALDTLAELGRAAGPAPTWAVLGDMLELGAGAEAEHRALGRYAAGSGLTHLVIVGEYAAVVAAGAAEAAAGAGPGAAPQILVVGDRDEAVAVVRRALGPTDVVLVKASRGLALETVAEELGAAGPGESATGERPDVGRRDDNRPSGDCA